MKSIVLILIVLLASTFTLAQNEQAPLLEKEISYKDWTYKSLQTGEDVNLRNFANGKKLVMIVYYAPWCPNWRFDAPILQKFHDKYRDKGLAIIAVGSYDPVESMKNNLNALKLTFPAVYESADRSARETTLHYKYRRHTGDARKWGSPWYIFLNPASMEKQGDVLTKKTYVINGEVIEPEGEAFIRKSLGLN